MKRFAVAMLCLGALASPALAQNIALDLPNLSYPPAPAPVSQGCNNPTSLAAPACPPVK